MFPTVRFMQDGSRECVTHQWFAHGPLFVRVLSILIRVTRAEVYAFLVHNSYGMTLNIQLPHSWFVLDGSLVHDSHSTSLRTKIVWTLIRLNRLLFGFAYECEPPTKRNHRNDKLVSPGEIFEVDVHVRDECPRRISQFHAIVVGGYLHFRWTFQKKVPDGYPNLRWRFQLDIPYGSWYIPDWYPCPRCITQMDIPIPDRGSHPRWISRIMYRKSQMGVPHWCPFPRWIRSGPG